MSKTEIEVNPHTLTPLHDMDVNVPMYGCCAPSYTYLEEAEPTTPEFKAYPKTKRIDAERVAISEKIDGSNGVLYIHKARFGDVKIGADKSYIMAGSRSKWLLQNPGEPNDDNHGFGAWVKENEDELFKLSEGYHYGEWYGKGINRNYGLKDRRFMLFNHDRYVKIDPEDRPKCVEIETKLAECRLEDMAEYVRDVADALEEDGSAHVPGFMKTEGLIVRLQLAGKVYKIVWDK